MREDKLLKSGVAAASVASVLFAMISVPLSRPEFPPVHPPPSLDDVPETLEECLAVLADRLPGAVLEAMRDGTEANMIQYHHGLGTWMRNAWGLWRGGPLYSHFHNMGLEHPDDMSMVVLTSFWRRLHGEPLRVEEQVQKYQAYWRTPKRPTQMQGQAVERGLAGADEVQ